MRTLRLASAVLAPSALAFGVLAGAWAVAPLTLSARTPAADADGWKGNTRLGP